MKKILLIFTFTILFLVLLAQIDDDLDEGVTSLIGRIDTNEKSDAYLYLLGIFAKEGESPIDVGESLLAEYRKLDANELYVISDYAEAKKILLPAGDAFCQWTETDCLERLFSSNLNVERLVNEHRVLLSRSSAFFKFNEYRTLSKPAMHEQLPPYHYLMAAERIKVIQAISVYRNGHTIKAVNLLLQQIATLRASLALQDNLIGKLVFLMKLSEVVDVYSVILSKEGAKADVIPSLSQPEKNFHMVTAREFGMAYNTFERIAEHPEFFEMSGGTPRWVSRFVFKPNMTVNTIAPKYYRLARLAQLSATDFANEMENRKNAYSSTSMLRNYVGYALTNVSPDFDEYVARFFDFDAKIALFNQLHHFKLKAASMMSPYYGNEVPKESNGSLCFSGPLADNNRVRCLRVKI